MNVKYEIMYANMENADMVPAIWEFLYAYDNLKDAVERVGEEMTCDIDNGDKFAYRIEEVAV